MRNYQKMDAYKVSFNASEQVSAAACAYFKSTASDQYCGEDASYPCAWKVEGTNWTGVGFNAGATGTTGEEWAPGWVLRTVYAS